MTGSITFLISLVGAQELFMVHVNKRMWQTWPKIEINTVSTEFYCMI